MTRIVRFEELNGELILRVPEDVARTLGFSAGDEVELTESERKLTVRRPEGQDQLAVGREVAARHREALARLAR